MSQEDIIFLHNLQVDITIGVHRWEQQIQQKLYLDLEISCDLSKAGQKDSLKDTIDYQKVTEHILEIASSQSFTLLEAFAEQTLQSLFKTFAKIQSLKMKINKPFVVKQAQSVGIIIERHRHNG